MTVNSDQQIHTHFFRLPGETGLEKKKKYPNLTSIYTTGLCFSLKLLIIKEQLKLIK